MWTANQALNGLIGSGVPHDWATHMIGHELTALWHVDHARSLAIIQPSLLRNQIENKRAKLEKLGSAVFDLQPTSDLAERTIDAMEALYNNLGVSTKLTEYEGEKTTTVDKVIEQLQKHGMVALGETQAITLAESRKVLENAIA